MSLQMLKLNSCYELNQKIKSFAERYRFLHDKDLCEKLKNLIDIIPPANEKENNKMWKNIYWWIINNINGSYCFYRNRRTVLLEINH